MTRTELPNRRLQVSFDFTYKGVAFVGSIGFDRLLRPREIFMSCAKTTTELEAVGRDAAILVSQLLQRDVSFDEIRKSMSRDEKGRASSLVGEMLDRVEHVTAEQCEGLLKP